MKTGWETKPLGDVCTLQRGFDLPTQQRIQGVFPLVSSSGVIDTHNEAPVEAPGVVTGRSGSVGNVFFIEEDFWPLNTTLSVRDFHGNHPRFVFYLLSQFDLKRFAGGTGVPTLNRNDVHGVPVFVPESPEEQQRIVAILDEAFAGIATARATAEQNRQNARALFESHLQSVFSQRGEGWVEKTLSGLCDIKHGFAFKSEFFTNEGDHVLLTPGNFYESGGYRDRGEKQKYYCGDIPSGFILEKNDLLVAMTEQAAGLLGSPILVPESGCFLHNQRLGLVTGKAGVPWLNEFFFHVFNTQSVRKEIHASASGVKVRHTSPTKIGEVVVAFPASIDEQRSIVSKLEVLREETQRLEALYQRKLEALDELKQSLLHQAFSGTL